MGAFRALVDNLMVVISLNYIWYLFPLLHSWKQLNTLGPGNHVSLNKIISGSGNCCFLLVGIWGTIQINMKILWENYLKMLYQNISYFVPNSMCQLASWLVWLKIYVDYYLLWMPTHLSGRTDFPISTCDREHWGWTWSSFRNLDMLFFLKYSQTLLCLTTWSTFDEGRQKNQYENLRKLLSHGICDFCFYLMELHHNRPSSSIYFLPFTAKCWHEHRLLRARDICLAFWFLYCTVTHYVSSVPIPFKTS